MNYENGKSSPKETNLKSIFFPFSSKCLWNDSPIGEKLTIGPNFYRPVTIICIERCIRLAHKHAIQQHDENLAEHQFNGFLLGNLMVDSDEMGITLYLDRFDPGVSNQSESDKTPTTPLPNDVIVPICFNFQPTDGPDMMYNYSTEQFKTTFQTLYDNIGNSTSPDLSKSLQMRIVCYTAQKSLLGNMANLEMRIVAVNVANSIVVAPVKSLPVISTALAKSLSSTTASFREGFRTGFLTMDQTRKLLLLLDCDPKVKQMPLIGVWISGITMIHHPYVLQAVLRFMFCSFITKRQLNESNQILIMLQTKVSDNPQFFQCSLQDQHLKFDISNCQTYIDDYKPYNPSSSYKTHLDVLPPGEGQDADFFFQAINSSSPYLPLQSTSPPSSPKPVPIDDVTHNEPLKHDEFNQPSPFTFQPARLETPISHVTEPSFISTETAPKPTHVTKSILKKRPITEQINRKPVVTSSWHNHLPQEALKLFRQQSQQMKILQDQIKMVLASQQRQLLTNDQPEVVTSSPHRGCDVATQTEWMTSSQAQQTDDVITTSIACGPEVDDVTTASSFSSVDKQRADDDVIEQLDRSTLTPATASQSRLDSSCNDITDDVTSASYSSEENLTKNEDQNEDQDQDEDQSEDEDQGEDDLAEIIDVIQDALRTTHISPSSDDVISTKPREHYSNMTSSSHEQFLLTPSFGLDDVTNTSLKQFNDVSKVLREGNANDISCLANQIARRYLKKNEAVRKSRDGDDVTKMPGMSLVSPCHMSLDTRRYMRRHRLLGDDDDVNESVNSTLYRQDPSRIQRFDRSRDWRFDESVDDSFKLDVRNHLPQLESFTEVEEKENSQHLTPRTRIKYDQTRYQSSNQLSIEEFKTTKLDDEKHFSFQPPLQATTTKPQKQATVFSSLPSVLQPHIVNISLNPPKFKHI